MIAHRDPFLASLLEATPDAFSRAAATELSRRSSSTDESEFSVWRQAMEPWLRSLAAALRSGRPELLASHARWLRGAAEARGQSAAFLTQSLDALEEALVNNLPPGAQQTLAPHFDAARAPLQGELELPESALRSTPLAEDVELMLEQLVAGDSRGAVARVRAAQERGVAPQEVILNMLVPAEREIGRLWHLDDLSVAEEHFSTRTIRRALAEVLARCDLSGPTRGVVVLGGTQADQHDLALSLLGGLFELEGWKAVDLGANLPPQEFGLACQRMGAQVALVSASLPTQLDGARASIEAIHNLSDAKVVAGGYAFLEQPLVWQDLGADAFASNLAEAVKVAEAWRREA